MLHWSCSLCWLTADVARGGYHNHTDKQHSAQILCQIVPISATFSQVNQSSCICIVLHPLSLTLNKGKKKKLPQKWYFASICDRNRLVLSGLYQQKQNYSTHLLLLCMGSVTMTSWVSCLSLPPCPLLFGYPGCLLPLSFRQLSTNRVMSSSILCSRCHGGTVHVWHPQIPPLSVVFCSAATPEKSAHSLKYKYKRERRHSCHTQWPIRQAQPQLNASSILLMISGMHVATFFSLCTQMRLGFHIKDRLLGLRPLNSYTSTINHMLTLLSVCKHGFVCGHHHNINTDHHMLVDT